MLLILAITSATLFLARVLGLRPSSGSGDLAAFVSSGSSILSSSPGTSGISSSSTNSSSSPPKSSCSPSGSGLGVSLTTLKALVLSNSISLSDLPLFFFSFARNLLAFFSSSSLYSSSLPSLVFGSGSISAGTSSSSSLLSPRDRDFLSLDLDLLLMLLVSSR